MLSTPMALAPCGEMAMALLRRQMADAPAAVPVDAEEARWVARAKAGDAAGQRWLLARYRTRTVRLAAHVLRGEADAEDVAQEAFVQAFRRLGTLRGTSAFGPWLRAIVVRRCLDRLRRAPRQKEVFGSEMLGEAFAAAAGNATAADPAARTDTRLLVEALLGRLSPPLRAALVLRECEGLEYDEIAQALGVPVGTVRSRLHSARAQFRALWLAAEGEDTPDA